jgi:hypothetical protein
MTTSLSNTFNAESCYGFDSAQPFLNQAVYIGPPNQPQESKSYQDFYRLSQKACNSSPGLCLNAVCNSKPIKTNIYVINSTREAELGIGRQWPYPKVPGL